MQALYQLDIQGSELLPRLMAEFFYEMEGDSRTRQLAWEWTSGAWAKVAECDELIGGSTIRWQFSRLSPVDRSILRLSVYQLKLVPGHPAEGDHQRGDRAGEEVQHGEVRALRQRRARRRPEEAPDVGRR